MAFEGAPLLCHVFCLQTFLNICAFKRKGLLLLFNGAFQNCSRFEEIAPPFLLRQKKKNVILFSLIHRTIG